MVLAPSNVVHEQNTTNPSTQIDISWIDEATNETGYEIQQSVDGGTVWTGVVWPDPDVEKYTSTGLRNGEEYLHRVRATGSTNSDWVRATTSAGYGSDYGANYGSR